MWRQCWDLANFPNPLGTIQGSTQSRWTVNAWGNADTKRTIAKITTATNHWKQWQKNNKHFVQVLEEDVAREDNNCSPNLSLKTNLSPRDVRHLVHAEEELSQAKVPQFSWNVFIWTLELFCLSWFFNSRCCSVSDFPKNLANQDVASIFQPLWFRSIFGKTYGWAPSSSVQNSPQNTFTETFELFYGQNRKAGQRMVNSYCKSKHHLQVPKPEQLLLPKADLGLNLPPLRELPQLKATMQVIFGRISAHPNSNFQLQEKKFDRKLCTFIQGCVVVCCNVWLFWLSRWFGDCTLRNLDCGLEFKATFNQWVLHKDTQMNM